MTSRKLLKIVSGLLVLFAVAIGLTSIKHPIILKWVTGSARHRGTPMGATVYTNGQVNEHINVYYTDEENTYLVSLPGIDSSEMLEFLNINLNKKWIGKPIATSKNDYDVIAGHLFENKTSGRFTPLQADRKGANFDPQLSYTDRQIKFNMPPGKVKFDSVRIVLP